MYLTPWQTFVMILALAAGTLLTRALPFVLFPENRRPPAAVYYLGRVLPPAVMGLLVVYCLKAVRFTATPYGLPELISILVVCLLHAAKHNTLLSIAGGTVCYMLLVQRFFV